MTEDAGDRVKVRFELPEEEEGWPPAESEDLWAIRVSPGVVQIDSIPWFARDVALKDLFAVVADDDGTARPSDKLQWSGNCTVRVIPLEDESPGIPAILGDFAGLGVNGEALGQYGIVALNVPPNVAIAEVKRVLNAGEAEGAWSYDEGCIGGAWTS